MTAQTNLLLRNDTILGVCEALGHDFGFNPNWLRVAFCVPIFWNPVMVVSMYLGLGVLVAATRFAFPDRHAEVPAAAPARPLDVVATATEIEDERELVAA